MEKDNHIVEQRTECQLLNNGKKTSLSPHPCGKHCIYQDLSSQHEQACNQKTSLDIF